MAIPILSNTKFHGDVTIDDHKVLYVGDGDLSMFCSTHAYLRSTVSDADLIFQVNDGGSNITALTLDGADDGKATFKSDIVLSGTITGATTMYGTSLKVGRQYTSSSDQELIDFSTDGRITLNVNGAEVRWNGSALVGGTDGARDLGSTLKQWKDLHLAGDLYVKGSVVQGTPAAVSESSGTHTVVLADNDNHNITVGNEATTIALTVASGDVGKTGMIVLTNPASVGSLSFVALPSYMLTPSGATINFVTSANSVSIISYYVHATDKVLVNYVGNFA